MRWGYLHRMYIHTVQWYYKTRLLLYETNQIFTSDANYFIKTTLFTVVKESRWINKLVDGLGETLFWMKIVFTWCFISLMSLTEIPLAIWFHQKIYLVIYSQYDKIAFQLKLKRRTCYRSASVYIAFKVNWNGIKSFNDGPNTVLGKFSSTPSMSSQTVYSRSRP